LELKRTRLSVRAEQAMLVGLSLPGEDGEESVEELGRLARTAGARVSDSTIQKRSSIDSTYGIGKGKVEELKGLCRRCDADVIIFDHDLKPAQVRNLEKATGLKVVDRTELILDIFATRAKSRQAKLQVELAQLEYAMPRLRRMWTHLSRVEGGIGMRGPGEQQLETDRRLARRRIQALKRSLKEIGSRRERQAKSRSGMVNVCLVGYTNAGKSTLMNALTGSRFFVEDRLFATLDTRTRKWRLKSGCEVLLSDTVGFIKKLPHHLVASFHATLEEVELADVLLHVVDATSKSPTAQIEAVDSVLGELGCAGKQSLVVFNKMDAARESVDLATAAGDRPSISLSALRKTGLDELEEALEDAMDEFTKRVRITAPRARGDLVSYVRSTGSLMSVAHDEDGLTVKARLRPEDVERIVSRDGVEMSPL
jgi:GTP-binding protein HflX